MTSGFPDWQKRIFSSAENFEQVKISATSTEATTSFGQQVKSILIYNDGNNAVHVNFDSTATTNNMKIVPKAWFVTDLKLTDIHTICASGETATLFCMGTY